jgi:hypothetical protein
MRATMALEKELETYRLKLAALKVHEGKYVLIQGGNVVETFTSYEDAIKSGYSKFGLNKDFLVKQIRSVEEVQSISPLGPAAYFNLAYQTNAGLKNSIHRFSPSRVPK